MYDYDDSYNDGNWSIQYDKDGNWEVDLSRHKLMIECISSDLYKFELSREAYHYDDMGFFSEPVAIHNNIQGGIGCFGATSSYTVEFDKL